MADIEGINVGEFGKVIALNCQDSDGVTQDLSAYTTSDMTVSVRSPDNTVNYTFEPSSATAVYQYTFQFTSDSYPKFPGLWVAQLKVESAGVLIKSKPFTILVDEGM